MPGFDLSDRKTWIPKIPCESPEENTGTGVSARPRIFLKDPPRITPATLIPPEDFQRVENKG